MDATYYYNLAHDQSNEKSWEASVNNFNKAQELDPQGKLVPLGYLYINRGNAYRGLGEFEKTLGDFKNALIVAPEHTAYIHQCRATVYQKLNRYEEAIKDFEISAALFLNQGDRKSHQIVTLQLDVLRVIMLNLLNEANRNPNILGGSTDYIRLRDFLAAGKWKEADAETARVMLAVAKREMPGWLNVESIDNFPCADLHIINQLWVKYSDGRFGFSVQKKIYQGLGGRRFYDLKIWEAFNDRVGWRKGESWLHYSDITFDKTAPEAHLPTVFRWQCGISGDGSLLSRRDL